MQRVSSSIAAMLVTIMVFMLSAIAGRHAKASATEAAAQASAERKPQLVVQMGHSRELWSVALSADGKYLVTGSGDNKAKLWDVDSAREIRSFNGHSGLVSSVALSADGKYLVTGSWDQTAKLWEIETGRELRTFELHDDVNSVALSGDGTYLVASSWNKAILWEIQTGKEISLFNGRTSSIAWSADSKYLASVGDKVQLWRVETGKEILSFIGHSNGETSVTFSADGKYLVTGSDDHTAKLWEVETGREIRTFVGHSDKVRSVALSMDGKYLATGSDDATARLWDVETGREIRSFIGYPSSMRYVALSCDGKYLVTSTWTTAATLWEVETGKELRTFNRLSHSVTSVALSADGKYLATGSVSDTAKIWELESGREIRTFTGHVADEKAHARYVISVAFSPDGRYLATASEDATTRLWEVETGRELRTFTPFTDSVGSVAFSADGKYLIAGLYPKGGAGLWDATTHKKIRTFNAPGKDDVSTIALSGDGKYVATGSEDRTKLWEVETGREIRAFTGDSDYVHSIALSADGKYLVIGSRDGVTKLQDVGTGTVIRSFTGPASGVNSVGLSADGKYMVTGTDDSTTRIWNLPDGKELCRLISFDDGNWAVVDSDGHFDVSNIEEIKGLHWVMPDEPMKTYPLEIFMRDYYEPRLLPRILNGEKLKETRNLSELNRVQPPVKITDIERKGQSDLVTVTVEVAKAKSERQMDKQGNLRETDVYDLRLFRDGQIVGEYTDGKPRVSGNDNELLSWRSEMRVNVDDGGKRIIKFENIRLPRKADIKKVEFSAYAFNEDRVKSQTDRKTFDIPADLTPRRGRAYIISVGVNAYENPEFDLRYSVNDARAIQQTMFVTLSKFGDYDQVVQVPLISDYEVHRSDKTIPSQEATKEDLAAGQKIVISKSAIKSNLKAVIDVLAGKQKATDLPDSIPNAANLRKQLQQAQPEDLVLISFSSHGYLNASGHFYFVLSDTGPGTGESISETLLHNLSPRFLSSVELSLWLRDVDAGEMLMIVDACHSAAAVQGQQFKPGPMGSRGLGQLSYDKGMRILTATQASDVAYGFGALKQGLLTYVLIKDGIEAGKADFKPVDGRITVSEWLEYGEQGVPKLLEEAIKQAKSQNARAEIKELVQKTLPDVKTQQPSLFDFARKRTDVVLVKQ